MTPEFTKWAGFIDLWKQENLECPGIYAIAYSRTDLSGKSFKYLESIVYFGLANVKGGLSGDLKRFYHTIISAHSQHGAADRFKMSLSQNVNVWKDKLYVSVMAFPECDIDSETPKSLMAMGDILKQEYTCFAEYVKRFKKMTMFNDKRWISRK